MPERILGWLFHLTRRYWITSVLLGTMLAVLISSIQKAKWVQDEAALSSALLLGILFGLLLAVSRYGGWFAALYGIVISLVITIQSIGRILPSLGDVLFSPFLETVEQMNLRVITTSLRIMGWMDTLQVGDNVQDTGLFVLLLGITLALSGIWLMWFMIRQRSVLLGLLPLTLLLAVNVHLSRQSLGSYMVFLLCALLLVARTEYNRQHEEWRVRRVDYPEQLGLEWGGSALALAVLIVLVARAAPLFGTAEGWRAISEWVNRAQEETNTTATRLFSGVNTPPPDPGLIAEVYVNTPDLGEIGAPISQGSKTVMWVSISDPAPIPPGLGGSNFPAISVPTHYWRSGIFSTYTGRGWEPVPLGSEVSQPEELPEEAPIGRYYLRQTFVMEARHSGVLFATNDPIQVKEDVNLREVSAGGGTLLEGQEEIYQVISSATRVTSRLLAGSSTEYPPEITNEYLRLPDTLPERVRTLAERVTGTDDPYHKALKVQNYLRENFTYDLYVPEAPENRDVVDYFLFDQPSGFCSHYASAMTVMLRAVGVPARIATGYAMGEFDPERQSYRVPESASHAWVEVYFHGYGWVEFEPTNGRSAILYPDESPDLEEASQPVVLEEPPLQAQPYFAALVLAAAAALLVLPLVLLRLFSPSRQAPVIQVDVLYRRMRRALAWAGLDAVSSTTPDEYLCLYDNRLEQYEQLNKALRQATALYRETTFSSHPPDPMRVRSVSQLWQNSFREWFTLWLRATWQRLRERVNE